jgi:hypothetical protein
MSAFWRFDERAKVAALDGFSSQILWVQKSAVERPKGRIALSKAPYL